MKNLIIMILVIGFMVNGIAAAPKYPEYKKAIKNGAKTKIELHVVNDDEIPVPNAHVKVVMGMISRSYLIEGQTDTNGIFIIEGKTKGDRIEREIEKEGHYSTFKKLCFIKLGEERQVKNGKWLPYGEKLTIVLREKKNPANSVIENYHEIGLKKTKSLNQWIGYDLEINDFVAPLGKGKTADFDVYIEWDGNCWGTEKFSGMRVNIRFSDPYSGYYVGKKNRNSAFEGAYIATTNNVFASTANFYSKKIENGEWEQSKFDDSMYWVVRSRCVVDEEGNLISANYSSIYYFVYGCDNDLSVGFDILRIFNQKPNDLNLEPMYVPKMVWNTSLAW